MTVAADADLVPVVDLDSPDVQTVLMDARALGVDVAAAVVESIEDAVDDARGEVDDKARDKRRSERRRAAARRRRPFWQTEPCPEWCEAVHSDEDGYGRRYHRGAPRVVAHVYGDILTRKDGSSRSMKMGLGNKPCVRAWISAHVNDVRPRVVIRNDDGVKVMLIDLTPEEATQLGLALVELAASVTTTP